MDYIFEAVKGHTPEQSQDSTPTGDKNSAPGIKKQHAPDEHQRERSRFWHNGRKARYQRQRWIRRVEPPSGRVHVQGKHG